jgi:serine/threonine protein kinase
LKGTWVVSCNPVGFGISSDGRVELTTLSGTIQSSDALNGSLRDIPGPLDIQPKRDVFDELGEDFVRHHLRFLAPETVTSSTMSSQSTVYGLGALLYEMITGHRVDNLGESDQQVDLLKDVHRHIVYTPIDPRSLPTSHAPTRPPEQLVDIIHMCLAKDADHRYISPDTLAGDLRRFIAFSKEPHTPFVVGKADRLGRFAMPKTPLYRQDALALLEDGLATHALINVWGLSGAGKSHLIEYWATQPVNLDTYGFLGRAKLDQHSRRPFASFSQIFECLMDRLIADPKVNLDEWVVKIKRTLDSQFAFFVSTLSPEYRRILNLDVDVDISRMSVSRPLHFGDRIMLTAFSGTSLLLASSRKPPTSSSC